MSHGLPDPDRLPDAMTYPALELLVQGYLSLDWPDDYATAWAAVDDFVASEPIASRLPDEVTRLMEAMPSEESLRELIIVELRSGTFRRRTGSRWRPGYGQFVNAWRGTSMASVWRYVNA